MDFLTIYGIGFCFSMMWCLHKTGTPKNDDFIENIFFFFIFCIAVTFSLLSWGAVAIIIGLHIQDWWEKRKKALTKD